MRMDRNKELLIGILLLAVLAGTAVVAGVFHKSEQGNVQAEPQDVPYIGSGGLSFTYPNSYIAIERQETYKGNPIHVVTLIDNKVRVPDMSDGPPAISIIEVQDSSNKTLEEWVEANSISNFALSPDKQLASTTLAGEHAVSYTHSGLYESHATALKHGGYVYILSVGSDSPEDKIVADFQNILQTVQFR